MKVSDDMIEAAYKHGANWVMENIMLLDSPDIARMLDKAAHDYSDKITGEIVPSVAVKALVWGEINTHGGRKIFSKSHGMEWRLDPMSRTLAADKAKAQAEFEAYIRSALSAQVQDAADLLEALEALLIAYCDPGNQGSDHDEKVEAARAAIAKAYGRE